MNRFNVALCPDKNYVLPALVSLISLFEHNKNHKICVYIVSFELTPKDVKLFRHLSYLYGQVINLIDSYDVNFNGFKTTQRFTKAMYYRFLLPDILNADTVLYIDCDTLIKDDISELFDIDIQGYACGVVEDANSDDLIFKKRLKKFGKEEPYFNSGVLYMNLKYWRENDVRDRLCDFIISNDDVLQYPDQDALNIVLSGKVKYLNYKYNFQLPWMYNLDDVRIDEAKYKDIIKAKNHLAIIHFTGNDKPWYVESLNDENEDFIKNYNHFMQLHKNLKLKRKRKTSVIDRIYYKIKEIIK